MLLPVERQPIRPSLWQNTNPHILYILYHIILAYGSRHPSLFRSHRRWRKLIPTLAEIAGIDMEETFEHGLPTIESRLRLPATDLLYEVCRVQKLSQQELAVFDDHFIDHLFELVETTRDHQDERLNYAVIRLIVSLLSHKQGQASAYRLLQHPLLVLTPDRAQRTIHGGYSPHQTQHPCHSFTRHHRRAQIDGLALPHLSSVPL